MSESGGSRGRKGSEESRRVEYPISVDLSHHVHPLESFPCRMTCTLPPCPIHPEQCSKEGRRSKTSSRPSFPDASALSLLPPTTTMQYPRHPPPTIPPLPARPASSLPQHFPPSQASKALQIGSFVFAIGSFSHLPGLELRLMCLGRVGLTAYSVLLHDFGERDHVFQPVRPPSSLPPSSPYPAGADVWGMER
jgi:hypothetical protein